MIDHRKNSGEGLKIPFSIARAELDVALMHRFATAQGWNLLPLSRIWSFGFKLEVIAIIVKELHPSVQYCIQQSLRAWAKIIQENNVQTLGDTFGPWFDVESTADESINQSYLLLNHPELAADSEYAFLRMEYDQAQMRTNFWTNRAAATVFGLSEAELNCRLASYDLDLPFSELDAVCIFLHLLLRDLAVPSVVRVKHLRFDTRAEGSDRFQLVCWSSLSLCDIRGTVIEVS